MDNITADPSMSIYACVMHFLDLTDLDLTMGLLIAQTRSRRVTFVKRSSANIKKVCFLSRPFFLSRCCVVLKMLGTGVLIYLVVGHKNEARCAFLAVITTNKQPQIVVGSEDGSLLIFDTNSQQVKSFGWHTLLILMQSQHTTLTQ